MPDPVYFDREPIATEVHFRYNDIKTEEDKTMKYYHIRPEYLSVWGENTDENTTVSAAEVEELSRQWGKPVPELLDQLIEIDAPAPELYDVTLSNRDCIFDSVTGVPFTDAISFARGRGGKYVVQMSRHGENYGSSFSYDTDADTFSAQDAWGTWEPISPDAICKAL